MNKLSSNLSKFIDIMPEEIDAVIVKDESNKRYLTGVKTPEAGTLLITHQMAYFIIDSRYIEVAKRFENNKLQVILQKNVFAQIADICKENNIKSVALETQTTSVSYLKALQNGIGDIINSEIDINELIMILRCIKSEYEINKIKEAQSIAEQGFEHILAKIGEGVTEKSLALELEFFMRSHGADAASFDIIFIAGKNTSLPHGVPSEYKLKEGDLITIDFGADVDGYKSDMTRTVALGSVSDKQKEIYDIVLAAQCAAIQKTRAGEICSDIDKTARDIISNAGYGEYFGHSLGHSVGLNIHESPSFSPKCNTVLKDGMILTVEPGIYLPQKFGVRIEDMLLIRENGVENLTKSDKSLIII